MLILLPENGGSEQKPEVTCFAVVMHVSLIETIGRGVKKMEEALYSALSCVFQLEHDI